MRKLSLIFLLGSIFLHWAVVSSLRQAESYEPGLSRSSKKKAASRNTLQVHFVPGAKPRPFSSEPADTSSIGIPTQLAATESGSGFLPAGQLTRLPAPIDDIDLYAALPDNDTLVASIGLTLLINAQGGVDDVIVPPQANEKARAFARNLANRFRNIRFKPGEIDGKPVRSELHITVVSEARPDPATHKNDAGVSPFLSHEF